MSKDEDNHRLKRIDYLLRELEYEVMRGLEQKELDEHMQYHRLMPSFHGSHSVHMSVVIEPVDHYRSLYLSQAHAESQLSGLRLVKAE